MSKTPQNLSPLTLSGYIIILIISFEVMPKLPHPSDALGWGLVVAGYAIVTGIVSGVWWWLANKYLGR